MITPNFTPVSTLILHADICALFPIKSLLPPVIPPSLQFLETEYRECAVTPSYGHRWPLTSIHNCFFSLWSGQTESGEALVEKEVIYSVGFCDSLPQSITDCMFPSVCLM